MSQQCFQLADRSGLARWPDQCGDKHLDLVERFKTRMIVFVEGVVFRRPFVRLRKNIRYFKVNLKKWLEQHRVDAKVEVGMAVKLRHWDFTQK